MITITESAAEVLRSRLRKEGKEDWGIRLGVKAGGCSGMEYVMRAEPGPGEKDRVFDCHGVKVIVDWKSFLYLDGLTLDYHDDLVNAHFVFSNPNAVRSCGCGTSFAVS